MRWSEEYLHQKQCELRQMVTGSVFYMFGDECLVVHSDALHICFIAIKPQKLPIHLDIPWVQFLNYAPDVVKIIK